MDPPPPAPKSRLELLSEACSGGALESCASLGQSYFDGRDAPQDLGRAIPLLRTACDGGVPSACNTLGDAYQYGKGVPTDAATASSFYTVGCDKGAGKVRACTSLAGLLQDGTGVPKDQDRAREILDTACDGDERSACSFLGLIHVEGLGVGYNNTNQRKGVRYYDKACHLGEPRACAHLSAIYRTGTILPPDVKKADAFLKEACDAGDSVSCQEIDQREESKKKAP